MNYGSENNQLEISNFNECNADFLASERKGIDNIPGEFESKHIKTMTNLKHQTEIAMKFSFNHGKKSKTFNSRMKNHINFFDN